MSRATNREELTKIKEVLSLTTDLFGYINYDFSDLGIPDATFDFFFQVRYQERWCSPVLEMFMVDKEISSESYTIIGGHILKMFQSKWDRMVNVALAEYDPLHNYQDDMVESITDNDDTLVDEDKTNSETITRTDNLTKTTSNTRTNDLEESRSVTDSSSNESSVYGFNSSDAVPSDENDYSGTKIETIENTGTVSDSGRITNTGTVGNVTLGSDTKDSSIQRDYTRDRTVSHTGNIGNLSYQNLLGQEIELWKWTIIDQVVSDVASVLTLNIY